MTHLKTLTLCNFRNYSEQTITLCPQINLFVGRNGQGKTNCLEAIALFIAGKSFRTSFLKDLILNSRDQFILHATFVKNNIEQSLSISYSAQEKKIIHNATVYPSFLSLIGILQGVIFAGFHDELVKGSPLIRRRFIDLHSAQIDPLYIHHLNHYQKALKERNFLLKQRKTDHLSLYEEIMSKSIPYILTQRLKGLEKIEQFSQNIHQELTETLDTLSLDYKSPFLKKDHSVMSDLECAAILYKMREKDLHFGFSISGPHKDEIEISLKGENAKKFSSEGQIQSVMNSLFLAEYLRLKENVDEHPLFCIDDFGQNLDKFRTVRLLNRLENMGQVFITTPEVPNYPFKVPVKIFEVDNGTIYPG